MVLFLNLGRAFYRIFKILQEFYRKRVKLSKKSDSKTVAIQPLKHKNNLSITMASSYFDERFEILKDTQEAKRKSRRGNSKNIA